MYHFFTPILENVAFGVAQFAYRKKHGARDALLYSALSWVAAFNDGCEVIVYLSDVSGAFEKADAELLMSKLTSFGLNKRLLAVIRSWLPDRDGYVVVSGEGCRCFNLRDILFQGAVWEPR